MSPTLFPVINAFVQQQLTNRRGKKAMKPMLFLAGLLMLLLAACQPIQPVATAARPAVGPSTDAEKIADAMSAAPMSVAKDATILDWPVDANTPPRTLREGTNGWVCRPDDPTDPTDDPRCLDANWLKLFGKPYSERDPKASFGVGYMLQGDSGASNDDPSMMMPMTGTGFLIDPPHLMIISPVPLDQKTYSSTARSFGGAWTMFKNTPTEHIMIPIYTVTSIPKGDDKIANALSAGPLSITGNAAVMDYPAAGSTDLVSLRAGTNGWTCIPDDPTNPANDPMCLDSIWLQWLKDVVAGKTPQRPSTYGIAYMLQGGSVADNDDPSIKTPAAGKQWQIDPPHIMILSPEPLDPKAYPSKMNGTGPWIMWGGTPFEHLMFPVEDPSTSMAMK